MNIFVLFIDWDVCLGSNISIRLFSLELNNNAPGVRNLCKNDQIVLPPTKFFGHPNFLKFDLVDVRTKNRLKFPPAPLIDTPCLITPITTTPWGS